MIDEEYPMILTFEEVLKILRIKRNLLLDLIHAGIIPAFRVGNRWRIRKTDLEDFIESQL